MFRALLLLYGCASPAPLTCPAWDDLGGWQVWGGAIVLQRDACGKSTTGAIRGPVDLHLTKSLPQRSSVGALLESSCQQGTLTLDRVQYQLRVGTLYVSSALSSIASARVSLPSGCNAALRLEITPEGS